MKTCLTPKLKAVRDKMNNTIEWFLQYVQSPGFPTIEENQLARKPIFFFFSLQNGTTEMKPQVKGSPRPSLMALQAVEMAAYRPSWIALYLSHQPTFSEGVIRKIGQVCISLWNVQSGPRGCLWLQTKYTGHRKKRQQRTQTQCKK